MDEWFLCGPLELVQLCRGVCGTCRAKLVTGTVTMDENCALEQDELDMGYVLTCQSHPTSKEVAVDFDV